MSEKEAFEAEYSKCDFGIEGHNFKKNPDGSYESQQTYTAFYWFKKGAALAQANVNEQSQAQPPSKNIADVLWGNKALMALNADLGLSMDQLVKVANAILQSQAQQTESKILSFDDNGQLVDKSQAQQEPIGEVQHYATPANLPAYVNVKWYGKPPKNGAKVYALPPAPEGE